MRLLKLLLLSVVFFSVLLLAFSALIPSTIRVSRAVDIRADREKLHTYLRDTSKWSEWNLYMRERSGKFRVVQVMDTDSLMVSSWESADRKFTSGMAIYQTRPDNLTLQWYFDFRLSWYPWEKIAGITYDRQAGPVMEESLSTLKRLVELNP